MLPHPRRLSKRRSSDGAAGATRQPVAVEGSWKQCIEKFRQELETQLKLIWLANSEQTREDAVEHLRRHFHSVFGNLQINNSEKILCGEIGQIVFSTMSPAVLPEAALNIRSTSDKDCYLFTMQMMAKLIVNLYAGPEVTSVSRASMHQVLKQFAVNMGAPNAAVRYRILQFVNFILKDLFEAGFVFQQAETSGENFLKKEIFGRVYDVNYKVAALAVEAVGHFQYEATSQQSTKAFGVLWFRMQDHESHFVRAAAVRAIAVLPQSAPAILRRAFDKHAEVRVAGFEIIGSCIAAKIIKAQLRSHLLMTGLNDVNGAVRAAATICLQTWLKDSNMDYGGLVNDKGVELGKPLHANKQIGMEIFDLTEEARILCGAGVDAAPSSTESRLKSPNENNLPHA